MSLGEVRPEVRASFTEVFSAALRGSPCTMAGLGEEPLAVPVQEWRRDADGEDLGLLGLCEGRTVDLGCGPGRLAAALARLGHVVLGVDVVAEAVTQTRARGVVAVRRDVFDPLPGEGRWHTALLADGNVGIGGDPVALLRRSRALLAPDGHVVVELAGPGVRSWNGTAVLRSEGLRSAPFRWAIVGIDDIDNFSRRAGLGVTQVHQVGQRRWCAVLSRPQAPGRCA